MPYLLVTAKLRYESGPSYVGDGDSDPELMNFLGAVKIREPCNSFDVYKTEHCIRKVLNMLETKGWNVVGSMAMDHQCIWTLHKSPE